MMEEETAGMPCGSEGEEGKPDTEDELAPEEIAAFEAADEREALAALFEHVRACSADGRLSAPADWAETGLVPPHMDAEDFEMFAYEYLEEYRTRREAEGEPEQDAPVYRTATRAVGIPQPIAAAVAVESESGETESDEAETVEPDETVDTAGVESGENTAEPLGFDIPEGYELVELEGELTLVPIEADDETDEIACDDIAVLVGKRSYYLYSKDFMTDRYAHWAFLACEDDRVATFVECVREESRTYPRPMALDSLFNEPFSMTDDEVNETWTAIRESGEYPDIQTTTASNGDVFFYSTEHLSPAYAASLAEWHAVERGMYL